MRKFVFGKVAFVCGQNKCLPFFIYCFGTGKFFKGWLQVHVCSVCFYPAIVQQGCIFSRMLVTLLYSFVFILGQHIE